MMEEIKQEIIELVNQIDNPRVLRIIRTYLLEVLSGINRKEG